MPQSSLCYNSYFKENSIPSTLTSLRVLLSPTAPSHLFLPFSLSHLFFSFIHSLPLSLSPFLSLSSFLSSILSLSFFLSLSIYICIHIYIYSLPYLSLLFFLGKPLFIAPRGRTFEEFKEERSFCESSRSNELVIPRPGSF